MVLIGLGRGNLGVDGDGREHGLAQECISTYPALVPASDGRTEGFDFVAWLGDGPDGLADGRWASREDLCFPTGLDREMSGGPILGANEEAQ